MNLDANLTLFKKKINYSNWIISLNVKCKSVNLLESSIGENLRDLGFDDKFLGITPKAQSSKEKNIT